LSILRCRYSYTYTDTYIDTNSALFPVAYLRLGAQGPLLVLQDGRLLLARHLEVPLVLCVGEEGREREKEEKRSGVDAASEQGRKIIIIIIKRDKRKERKRQDLGPLGIDFGLDFGELRLCDLRAPAQTSRNNSVKSSGI